MVETTRVKPSKFILFVYGLILLSVLAAVSFGVYITIDVYNYEVNSKQLYEKLKSEREIKLELVEEDDRRFQEKLNQIHAEKVLTEKNRLLNDAITSAESQKTQLQKVVNIDRELLQLNLPQEELNEIENLYEKDKSSFLKVEKYVKVFKSEKDINSYNIQLKRVQSCVKNINFDKKNNLVVSQIDSCLLQINKLKTEAHKLDSDLNETRDYTQVLNEYWKVTKDIYVNLQNEKGDLAEKKRKKQEALENDLDHLKKSSREEIKQYITSLENTLE
jgi:hypothetical protein